MNWRSVADLHRVIAGNLHSLPRDVDAVVGVPRSGMLPATLVALARELPLADVESAAAGRWWGRKTTPAGPVRRVLLVDDSVRTGKSMARAVAILQAGLPEVQLATLAVFAAPWATGVDIELERVGVPRVFEWNLWRHTALRRIVTDLDGVLCPDPPAGVDDDGSRYAEWVEQVPPLHLPRLPVKAIITCRLERFRPQTERWLAEHRVRYGRLYMVDLPNGAERRRLKVHIPHKVAAYRDSGADLFVESSPKQAAGIAKATGRPVLCWQTRSMA